MCKFFVVPGNGQALLGMPDIDMHNIIKINCDTIGTHRNDSANKAVEIQPSTRVQNIQHYTKMMQDVDRVRNPVQT